MTIASRAILRLHSPATARRTVKAIVYHQYGSPDVLEIRDVDQPVPGDDDVLVRVHAASINSWDWDLLTGTPWLSRIGGLRQPRYEILGVDMAGRVEAVGKNVTRFQPGDDVCGDLSGSGFGAFAEYVAVPARALARKSAEMTFEQAAAMPHAGVLAVQGLRKGGIESAQRVLLNGAGGGVGTIALQIAKSHGAEATVVDRAEKLDLLRSLGADHVIDYTKEDFTKTGQRYDLILDVVANRSIFAYRGALSDTGSFVMIGGTMPSLLQAGLLGAVLSRTGTRQMGILVHRPNTADLDHLNELFEAGTVVPVIERTYPLSETADALAQLGAGHAKGKLVITM